MENLKENKKIIFICIIILLFAIIVYYVKVVKNKGNGEFLKEEVDIEIKHYEANEFIPVYMTEEQIVSKYLIEYRNLMLNDIEEAYNTLNEKYRKIKFKDLNEFINYVNNVKSMALYQLQVERYSKKVINGYKCFDIVGTDGYRYIIKEISIMNYEVYLDDYTVEIK